MRYTSAGEVVRDLWTANGDHYTGVSVDEFIVMPSHLHGILALSDHPETATLAIGEIVRRYKSIVAIRLHKDDPVVGDVWQRNYFEHVIRNDRDLRNAREYVLTNVLRWELDRLNPEAKGVPLGLLLPGGLVTIE